MPGKRYKNRSFSRTIHELIGGLESYQFARGSENCTEAVLAQATYLTRNLPGARAALMEMLGEDFLNIGMALADHHSAILAMIRRYAEVPMSLADACLVRLAELYPQSLVLTLDSDFLVYRKNGWQAIDVLRP